MHGTSGTTAPSASSRVSAPGGHRTGVPPRLKGLLPCKPVGPLRQRPVSEPVQGGGTAGLATESPHERRGSRARLHLGSRRCVRACLPALTVAPLPIGRCMSHDTNFPHSARPGKCGGIVEDACQLAPAVERRASRRNSAGPGWMPSPGRGWPPAPRRRRSGRPGERGGQRRGAGPRVQQKTQLSPGRTRKESLNPCHAGLRRYRPAARHPGVAAETADGRSETALGEAPGLADRQVPSAGPSAGVGR